MSLFENTAEDYLKLIGNWVDPNPEPVIIQYEGIHVVRDDLLTVGTKARGADYLIGHAPEFAHIQEWVYGSSPATGYAQMSLPYVCSKYGKKAVIFMAARKEPHPYQVKAIELGADMRWVPNGMLNVTEKKAKDYVAEKPETRKLVPIGLEHPMVFGCLIRVARSLQIRPREVWSVGSSGTLSRSLQMAYPDADIHVVSSGGHSMDSSQIGRATFHPTPYKFTQSVKKEELPPFPSVPSYDAKAWAIMKQYYKTHKIKYPTLFWNVAA